MWQSWQLTCSPQQTSGRIKVSQISARWGWSMCCWVLLWLQHMSWGLMDYRLTVYLAKQACNKLEDSQRILQAQQTSIPATQRRYSVSVNSKLSICLWLHCRCSTCLNHDASWSWKFAFSLDLLCCNIYYLLNSFLDMNAWSQVCCAPTISCVVAKKIETRYWSLTASKELQPTLSLFAAA